ncbi:macrolide family glycosyltransferase [Actinoplanes sp. NPDC048796]|uniref:macrolide family glycosyltransferase n=1 Tax=unclassified Actinoplanes TaxID=2626549 RepID=UPI0033E0B746
MIGAAVSHIAFLSIPSHGHIIPTLDVVRELVRRGHRVTYVTTEEFAGTVAAAGAEPVRYASTAARYQEASTYQREEVMGILMMSLEEGTGALDALEPVLRADRPDLLVYDLTLYTAGRAASRKHGIPAVQTFPIFASNERFSLAHRVFQRAGGAVGVLNGGDSGGLEFLTALRDWLERYLPGGGASAFEVLTTVEPLNLVFLPREFQIEQQLFDERFQFVGPCQDLEPGGQWQPPGDGRPVVLASLGTTYGSAKFFRMCAEAFAGLPLHMVMTTGDKFDVAELGPLPSNIEARPWVPHLDVLAHAGVLVTQGGMSSTMQALALGVPLVVVPHGGENAVNADRLAELGCGTLLPPEELTAAALRRAVTETLADEGMREAAVRMSRHVAAAGGAPRAAEVLEARIAEAVAAGRAAA